MRGTRPLTRHGSLNQQAARCLPQLRTSFICCEEGSQLQLDAWKLSHHAGKKNTSPELIQLIRCGNFLLPTSGARYHHPNQPTIARILALKDEDEGVTFHFNYRSNENKVWDDDEMRDEWNYQTRFPPDGETGLNVDLL